MCRPARPHDDKHPTSAVNASRDVELYPHYLVAVVSVANDLNRRDATLSRAVQFLSRPDLFKQIYTHTDVRLGLGYASVIVAACTGLYGYKVDFESSKPVVWAGLIL